MTAKHAATAINSAMLISVITKVNNLIHRINAKSKAYDGKDPLAYQIP